MEIDEIDKPIFYKDNVYLIIRFDERNFALLEREKLLLTDRVSKGVIGYYGIFENALKELVNRKSEKKLLDRAITSQLFDDYEAWVYAYLKEKRETFQTLVRTLETKLDERVKNQFRKNSAEITG